MVFAQLGLLEFDANWHWRGQLPSVPTRYERVGKTTAVSAPRSGKWTAGEVGALGRGLGGGLGW